MKDIATWIHRYLGLALAGFLLVAGLSGTAIVFNKSIDETLNPALLQVTPQSNRASIDGILQSARIANPNRQASFVFLPQAEHEVAEVRFRDTTVRAYVDPYSGKLLGIRDANSSLMGFLIDLHVHLLSGKTGEKIMGWIGLATILLSGLGLWAWWPKRGAWRKAFSVKWSAAPIRIWLDLHKVLGVVVLLFLLVTATTGAALALFDIVTEPILIALTGEGARKPAPKSKQANGAKAPIDAMMRNAALIFPDAQITRITLPTKPDAPVGVRMRLPAEIHQFGRTFIWFNQYSGSLIRVDNALKANVATKIQSWLFPLHTGAYGGLPTRITQLFVGVSLAVLTVSGVWVWWRRCQARNGASKRIL